MSAGRVWLFRLVVALNTDLHEAGDTHDGLVGLVEHLPPGDGAARRPGLLHFLGQEVGDVGHGPVGVAQLSVEEVGGDVVLQQSLDDRQDGESDQDFILFIDWRQISLKQQQFTNKKTNKD